MTQNSNGEAKPISEIKDARARKELPELCREYRRFLDQEKAAQAAKNAIMDEIKVHAKRARIKKVAGDDWQLTRVPEGKGQIQAKKLIEKGIDPDLIEDCKGVRSAYYKVSAL
jgi:hypothetical protein